MVYPDRSLRSYPVLASAKKLFFKILFPALLIWMACGHASALSKGFRYDIEFGLDYGVQSRICDEIPKLFEKGLWTYLERHNQKDSPGFTYTKVSFDNAGSSALNLKVLVDVEGRCAESYEEIRRDIHSTLVRICNENNLVIPFNQLTVTLPDNLKLKA